MSKIIIDKVSLEIIGTTVHLSIPSEYSLVLNAKSIVPSSIPYSYASSQTSSLASQIESVESCQSNFGDK